MSAPDELRDEELDEQESESEGAEDGEGAGPAEDLEDDPAYSPEDENLKGIKGG